MVIEEFDLIKTALKKVSRYLKEGLFAPGDDSVLLDSSLGKGFSVLSKDLLVEDVHFKTKISSPEDVGWKALAVNHSDICAMGAKIYGYLIGVAGPIDDSEFVLKLYQGFSSYLDTYPAYILGGDIVRAPCWMISVTAIGYVDSPISRAGAVSGDELWISGAVGASGIGLELSLNCNEKSPFDALTKEFKSHCIKAHIRPVPSIEIADFLSMQSGCTAMIDVSDGLFQDLGHLLSSSKLSAFLEVGSLPSCLPRTFSEYERVRNLTQGEDYQLLFSLTPKTIQNELRECFPEAMKIGILRPQQSTKIEIGVSGGSQHRVSLEEYLKGLNLDPHRLGYLH